MIIVIWNCLVSVNCVGMWNCDFCIALCLLIHFSSKDFLILTSAALYWPLSSHIHLLTHSLHSKLFSGSKISNFFLQHKNQSVTNVTRMWRYCTLLLDSVYVCYRGTSLLWYCVSVYLSGMKTAQDHWYAGSYQANELLAFLPALWEFSSSVSADALHTDNSVLLHVESKKSLYPFAAVMFVTQRISCKLRVGQTEDSGGSGRGSNSQKGTLNTWRANHSILSFLLYLDKNPLSHLYSLYLSKVFNCILV